MFTNKYSVWVQLNSRASLRANFCKLCIPLYVLYNVRCKPNTRGLEFDPANERAKIFLNQFFKLSMWLKSILLS